MKAKLTGVQFKAFINDEKYWGEHIVDDEVVSINGEIFDQYSDEDIFDRKIADDDKIIIIEGSIYFEDDGFKYTKKHQDSMVDFGAFAKAWLKKQSTLSLVISFSREIEDQVRKSLKEIKGITISGG